MVNADGVEVYGPGEPGPAPWGVPQYIPASPQAASFALRSQQLQGVLRGAGQLGDALGNPQLGEVVTNVALFGFGAWVLYSAIKGR